MRVSLGHWRRGSVRAHNGDDMGISGQSVAIQRHEATSSDGLHELFATRATSVEITPISASAVRCHFTSASVQGKRIEVSGWESTDLSGTIAKSLSTVSLVRAYRSIFLARFPERSTRVEWMLHAERPGADQHIRFLPKLHRGRNIVAPLSYLVRIIVAIAQGGMK